MKYCDLHACGNDIVNIYSRHVREEQDALIELQERI